MINAAGNLDWPAAAAPSTAHSYLVKRKAPFMLACVRSGVPLLILCGENSSIELHQNLGWLTSLELATSGTTTRRSAD